MTCSNELPVVPEDEEECETGEDVRYDEMERQIGIGVADQVEPIAVRFFDWHFQVGVIAVVSSVAYINVVLLECVSNGLGTCYTADLQVDRHENSDCEYRADGK